MASNPFDQIGAVELLVVRRIIEDRRGSMQEAAEALYTDVRTLRRKLARVFVDTQKVNVPGDKKPFYYLRERRHIPEIAAFFAADRAASGLIQAAAIKRGERDFKRVVRRYRRIGFE